MKLPKRTLSIIKEIISEAPRNGLELLLVCAGAKPGDIFDFLSPLKARKLFVKYVEELKTQVPIDYMFYERRTDASNLLNFSELAHINEMIKDYVCYCESEQECGQIMYYNTLIVSQELALKVKALFEGKASKDYDYCVGVFYGYPRCCINANINGSGMKKFCPYTEHFWCTPNCKESKKIALKFKNTVKENFPEYMDLLKTFGRPVKTCL